MVLTGVRHEGEGAGANFGHWLRWLREPMYWGLCCFALHSAFVAVIAWRNWDDQWSDKDFNRLFYFDTPAIPLAWFFGEIPLHELGRTDRLLMFGIIGGLQWFLIGLITRGGWIAIEASRQGSRWIPASILIALNSCSAMLATLGILRLKLVEMPPFLDGLYDISVVFFWPPHWLVLCWASSIGSVAVWMHSVMAPALVFGFRRHLAVRGHLWVPCVVAALLPSALGAWIWLHALINTFP